MARRLFVASIGNPSPYRSSLHSAGHRVLEALQKDLGYPGFSGNTSSGAQYHLFRSPAFMNTSGNAVQRAYRKWLSGLPATEKREARLILLHDELESPLGKVRMRTGGSPRGHNGLKSVAAALGAEKDHIIKIGIGIGRPTSRDPDDVARYVLRDATPSEAAAIQGASAEVGHLLQKLAEEDDVSNG